MQTFLPYADIYKSVSCLDYRRLGKQRVEAYQILRSLTDESYGWKNHPAVKMWDGYEQALILYMNACISEWVNVRGYKNSMKCLNTVSNAEFPPWFGDEAIHASHRSNLLRKDSKWYGQFGWSEPNDINYVWPV